MRSLRVAVALTVVGSLMLADAAAAPAGEYAWPLVPRPTVTRPFDPPAQRWLTGHRGVDLGTVPDAPVLAARAGTVHFAGSMAGRPLVSLMHPDGIITTYEPVTPTVRRGDHVRRGEVIGTVVAGHAGCTAAACLHWGARRGSGRTAVYLNPLALLGLLRVRLKPVTLAGAPDRAPPAGARR